MTLSSRQPCTHLRHPSPPSPLRLQAPTPVRKPSHAARLQATPYTLHPAPCTLHPAPCTLHPAPCTLHPAPSASIRLIGLIGRPNAEGAPPPSTRAPARCPTTSSRYVQSPSIAFEHSTGLDLPQSIWSHTPLLPNYSRIKRLGLRCKFVNIGCEKGPGSAN